MSIRWRRPRPFSLAESHGKRSPKGGGGQDLPSRRVVGQGGVAMATRRGGGRSLSTEAAFWRRRRGGGEPRRGLEGRGSLHLGGTLRSARLPPLTSRRAPRAPSPTSARALPPTRNGVPPPPAGPFLTPPFWGPFSGGVRPGLAGLTGPPSGFSSSQTLLTAGTQCPLRTPRTS